MRFLYTVTGGIGNVIQCTPAIRALSVLGDVDILHVDNQGEDWIRDVFANFHDDRGRRPNVYTDEAFPDDYTDQAYSYLSQQAYHTTPRLKGVPSLNVNLEIYNEVDGNMSALWERALPVTEAFERARELYSGVCSYDSSLGSAYDVCLHDGGRPEPIWRSKRWVHYAQLAERCAQIGLSACSIGRKEEYIPGTADETGHRLLASAGVIRRSRVYVGNDCGTYHVACALDVPTVVLFTSTRISKNYHSKFHRTATVLRHNLPCQPCQHTFMWGDCRIEEVCRRVVGVPLVLAEVERKLAEGVGA